ncbi:MAG: S8 family serine peptidase [Candidatus Dormibacteria bacterium]
MAPVHGISWDDRKRRTVTAAATAAALMLSAGALATTAHADTHLVSVIVRAQPTEGAAADQQITALGGHIQQHISLINAIVATVPASSVPELEASSAVAQVTLNAPVQLLGSSYGLPSNPYNPTTDVNSMYNIEQMDGAHAYWNAGYTGQGVGVALIDSGVTPVNGLTTQGKVVNGPDLSFESQDPSLQYLDTFGHGTHMAGIIAGRDDAVTSVSSTDTTHFLGMAPDAQIVSIKVADALGETDVSQVLAAIDWVVQHQNDNGMNIRVLNLSYGTDSNQSYVLDPLAYAAEQAWLHGIVVVVADGNQGNWSNGLDDPAIDPYVIAVGAANTENTTYVRYHLPAGFTSEGDGTRNPDLSAPGVHVVSLRDPGSLIDDQFGGSATVSNRFFLGSGTSQAAAVVSGAAALLLSQRPNLTPDQVKALLDTHAHSMYGRTSLKGSGELNLAAVLTAPAPNVAQGWPTSNGTGSLDASRGSRHVLDTNGNALTGEQDIFGNNVDTTALAAAEASASAWNSGIFNGSSWSGSSWSGSSWSGSSWSGSSWSGSSWSGASWSGASWSGASWSGASWSGASWSGASWSGASWSDSSWSDYDWS